MFVKKQQSVPGQRRTQFIIHDLGSIKMLRTPHPFFPFFPIAILLTTSLPPSCPSFPPSRRRRRRFLLSCRNWARLAKYLPPLRRRKRPPGSLHWDQTNTGRRVTGEEGNFRAREEGEKEKRKKKGQKKSGRNRIRKKPKNGHPSSLGGPQGARAKTVDAEQAVPPRRHVEALPQRGVHRVEWFHRCWIP